MSPQPGVTRIPVVSESSPKKIKAAFDALHPYRSRYCHRDFDKISDGQRQRPFGTGSLSEPEICAFDRTDLLTLPRFEPDDPAPGFRKEDDCNYPEHRSELP